MFENSGVLAWLAIVHVAFLVVPGLMVLSHEWMHDHSFHFTSRKPHRHLRPIRH